MRYPLLADVMPVHPVTGLTAIGIGKRGPIWPVMGGAPDDDEGTDDSGDGEKPDDKPTEPAKPAADGSFPANTPVAEMTAAEQANYWKAQARRHETANKKKSDYDDLKKKAAEYDRLADASKTDQEKAVETARKEGADAARAETQAAETKALRLEVALDKALPKALALRLQGDTREELEADADELLKLIPKAADKQADEDTSEKRSDLGQGKRTPANAKSGLEAGAEIYRRLFPASTKA
jgi:hypothetical protein